MKSLIALALCASAVSVAAPALAQPYGPPPGSRGVVEPGHGLREQLDTLEGRVQEGIRAGQIDRGEADRANRELGSIRGEMARLREANGRDLSDLDRGRLQERLDALSRSIHWMRQNAPAPTAPLPPPRVVTMPPPAYGQPAPGQIVAGDWSLERREAWLQERITKARADGSLSRRDAYRAQMALNDIKAQQARMIRRSGRLHDNARAVLEQRLDRLRDTIRWSRQSNDNAPPWRR
jgi:hypothetical protein